MQECAERLSFKGLMKTLDKTFRNIQFYDFNVHFLYILMKIQWVCRFTVHLATSEVNASEVYTANTPRAKLSKLKNDISVDSKDHSEYIVLFSAGESTVLPVMSNKTLNTFNAIAVLHSSETKTEFKRNSLKRFR